MKADQIELVLLKHIRTAPKKYLGSGMTLDLDSIREAAEALASRSDGGWRPIETPEKIEEWRLDALVVAEILHDRGKRHEAAGREREAEAFAGYEEACRKAAYAISCLRRDAHLIDPEQ